MSSAEEVFAVFENLPKETRKAFCVLESHICELEEFVLQMELRRIHGATALEGANVYISRRIEQISIMKVWLSKQLEIA